ncbi:putative Planctomycete cytochrome C [uncultured Desulfatiglans sp.]|uniref:Putative Planctomycete cytochrome C n=1 Tax=Uncultured Desulfatiglans sp. TaxID=1748965 RepID=A0A653AC59_UNCDX|nr:putative Planctomycete cytochrome C [uncultured Desulfatiglans sp.]
MAMGRHTARTATLLVLFLCGAGAAEGGASEGDHSWTFEMSPAAQYAIVDGDERKFSEDWWMPNGWMVGLERFFFKKPLGGGWTFNMEGHALFPGDDYRVDLLLEKAGYGFVRGRYGEYRKYFDDTGGFFHPFRIPAFSLDRDLQLDIGELALEFGITVPEWPEIAGGYERRFKKGEKSLLQWGSVAEDGLTRKIYPAYKEVDEKLDVFKVKVSHDISGIHLEDSARYERSRIDTGRFEQEFDIQSGEAESVSVYESSEYDALYNTLYLESRFHEKAYLSMGYLYNDLDGDAAFRMFTVPFGPEPFDKDWSTSLVDFEQESHVLNLNAMLGPIRDLSLQGGIQGEFIESRGRTKAELLETSFGGEVGSPETEGRSSVDRNGFDESIELRYGGIPYTALYAEGKWTQQEIDLFEDEFEDGVLAFERLTDSDVSRRRYTFGVSTSPIRRLTLSGHYRRSVRKNDYDHKIDSEESGYSAFIEKQEWTSDEIKAKIGARMTARLKGSLQYQFVDAKIDTASATQPPSLVESNGYKANIYSLSLTASPTAKMYVTGIFSYSDISSESFDNGAGSVVGYDGDVYSFIGTAGWSIGKNTDLTLEYLYSGSDNFQDNSEEGLPLGIDNDRHGLRLGCSRKINDQLKVRFKYGFYKYTEDSNNGIDDYRAHLLGLAFEYAF